MTRLKILQAACGHVARRFEDHISATYGIIPFSCTTSGLSYFSTSARFDADMEKMAQDPQTQEWWMHTHPCFGALCTTAAANLS